MSRNRTSRQWREILDAFDRSELSQAEFCRRRGLALASFRYYRARAAASQLSSEAPRLVELFAAPAVSEPSAIGELRLQLVLPLGPISIHGRPAPLADLLSLLASTHPVAHT